MPSVAGFAVLLRYGRCFLLTVTDLTVEYTDGTRAIDAVRFSIDAGENVALIGANGAGKTSLLLALVGVLPPKSGFIHVGETILDKKTLLEVRSRIGMVFQSPDDQLFMPSVFEDAAFGPRSFGCDEAETTLRVNAALSRLGIAHLAERSPLKLSGGEKRLAAIATVITMNPEFLLFDEPTAFLDPRARRNMVDIIADLLQGKLIATHDLAFAEKTCSRVLLLQNGKLTVDGGMELLRDSSTLIAAGL